MSTHAARREALRRELNLLEADAFVSVDPTTIRYLTGFSGSNGGLLVTDRSTVVATDGRYLEQIAAESPGIDVLDSRDVIAGLAGLVAGARVFVDDRMSIAQVGRLQGQAAGVEPIVDPVVNLRIVKDERELAAIAKACAITAQALAETAVTIAVGDSEIAVARRLEERFGLLGAQDRAFPTIVGSGPNSAIPHHRASERRLAAGDLVVIDCGALVDGYHADMTRTYVVGSEPEVWQAQIHDVVARAQAVGRAALRPGRAAREVDHAVRSVITESGYGEYFTHGTGHGVGLQIHEAPMISAVSSHVVPPDCVVTIEPGIYLAGRGGVRIEDSVYVGSDVKVLTDLPHGLTRVG